MSEESQKRYTITINVVELDEDGSNVGEYCGVTLDVATTEAEILENIKGKLYEDALRHFDREVPETSVTSRRPLDSEWLDTWLEIGQRNPWIKEANDPPFDEDSFLSCASAEHLARWVTRDTSWSLGVAFFWDDQCWINQVEGGSEFLVIKEDVSFESISAATMERREPGRVLRVIKGIAESTPEQCRDLKYKEIAEVASV